MQEKMAANSGRGQMRPHNAGRTPSFVVVGLMIVIAILGFNYWNVSSKNSMLAREVNESRDRIRFAAVKKLAMEKRNDALMQKVRSSDMELDRQKTLSGKTQEEVDTMRSQLDAKQDEVTQCRTEKDSYKSELVSQKPASSLIPKHPPPPTTQLVLRWQSRLSGTIKYHQNRVAEYGLRVAQE